MRYRSSRLTPIQATLASEVLPGYTMGASLMFENTQDMQQSMTVLKAEELSSQKGRLRCLRTIILKVEAMIENPYGYEKFEKENQREKPLQGDRVISCTASQVALLRGNPDIRYIRWSSSVAKKADFYVSEKDAAPLIQLLQDMYHNEIVPSSRRVLSSVARKVGDENGEPRVNIKADPEIASEARMNCLKYVCSKIGIEFNPAAATVADAFSRKHLKDVITELKLLAALVKGSSRMAWSLISKLERMRGGTASPESFHLEVAMLQESEIELPEIELPETQTVTQMDVRDIDVVEESLDLGLSVDEDEGPNCFFADEPYEEDTWFDDDDEDTPDWFVFSAIPTLVEVIFVEQDEDSMFILEGDDISFKVEADRDDWCHDMKVLVESLAEEIDDVTLDLCFQEILTLERMVSLV